MYNGLIHNSQKMEGAQMSISEGVDKQITVHKYNGMLPGPEKGWSSDTSHNKDEPWEHSAKWKKPGA